MIPFISNIHYTVYMLLRYAVFDIFVFFPLACIDVTCADGALTYSIHMLTDYLPCEARDYRDVDGTQTHSSNIRERQLKQQTGTIHMLRLCISTTTTTGQYVTQ